MPELGQLVSYIIALLGVSGGVLAYFKRKPGEKQAEIVSVGSAEIDIAHGTVRIAADAAAMQKAIAEQLEEQLAGLRGEMAHVRSTLDDALEDLRTVKGRLITATQQIKKLESENRLLRQERDELRARVVALEAG